jgi:hypothetical protein
MASFNSPETMPAKMEKTELLNTSSSYFLRFRVHAIALTSARGMAVISPIRFPLLVNDANGEPTWRCGVLIEADTERFQELKALHDSLFVW